MPRGHRPRTILPMPTDVNRHRPRARASQRLLPRRSKSGADVRPERRSGRDIRRASGADSYRSAEAVGKPVDSVLSVCEASPRLYTRNRGRGMPIALLTAGKRASLIRAFGSAGTPTRCVRPRGQGPEGRTAGKGSGGTRARSSGGRPRSGVRPVVVRLPRGAPLSAGRPERPARAACPPMRPCLPPLCGRRPPGRRGLGSWPGASTPSAGAREGRALPGPWVRTDASGTVR